MKTNFLFTLHFVSSIHQILKQYWGFEKFRPLQEEIIQSVLNGKDTLALLPTGGGKSICFQVPALALDGMCLVISPLIALMKDQVYNLNQKGIKATAIYSGLPYRVIDTLLDNCVYGKVKFLYLSPERLSSDDFRMRMQKMNIRLLVVDEAHCISQWGYDFRPPYLRIAEVREQLKDVPVIALTATATPAVATDIQNKLLFRQSNLLQKSFVRKNLSYVVRQSLNKEQSVLDILSKVNGSAVVYVRNRKATKTIADFLMKHKIKADFYHAGLEPNERSKKQDNWIKNKTRVICCTNAFGMGIDKPDVRTVIHVDVAESIEAYFQEAGRAGRDENKAYAVQLINSADTVELDKKIAGGYPQVEFIRDMYDSLCQFLRIPYHEGINRNFEFALETFSDQFHVSVVRAMAAFKILEQQEIIYISETLYALSQIKCSCSKETLVRFQEDNKALEPMVKFILRTSEGIFEDFCPVDEYAIAPRLKITVQEVTRQLQALHKFNIFNYQPRKNKPQIIFLQNRVKKEDLRLNLELMAKQKEDFENRLKAVRDYVSDNTLCRTRTLVKYFGETITEDCGICDVCAEQKRRDMSAEEFYSIVKAAGNELKKGILTVSELQLRINLPAKKMGIVVDYMVEKKMVERIIDNQLRWL